MRPAPSNISRGNGKAVGPAPRLELPSVSREHCLQFAEVFHDEVRFGGAQLVEAVVPREHSHAGDARLAGCVEVVTHAAHEQCLPRRESLIREQADDAVAFVVGPQTMVLEKLAEAGRGCLSGEPSRRDGTEHEGADISPTAEFEECPRVGQSDHGVLELEELLREPMLDLVLRKARHPGQTARQKGAGRKLKLVAELVEGQFGHTRLGEQVVDGLPNRREIVHQGPRPVEDHVADHQCTICVAIALGSSIPPQL